LRLPKKLVPEARLPRKAPPLSLRADLCDRMATALARRYALTVDGDPEAFLENLSP